MPQEAPGGPPGSSLGLTRNTVAVRIKFQSQLSSVMQAFAAGCHRYPILWRPTHLTISRLSSQLQREPAEIGAIYLHVNIVLKMGISQKQSDIKRTPKRTFKGWLSVCEESICMVSVKPPFSCLSCRLPFIGSLSQTPMDRGPMERHTTNGYRE